MQNKIVEKGKNWKRKKRKTYQGVIHVAISVQGGKALVEIVVDVDWTVAIVLVYDGCAEANGDLILAVFQEVGVRIWRRKRSSHYLCQAIVVSGKAAVSFLGFSGWALWIRTYIHGVR